MNVCKQGKRKVKERGWISYHGVIFLDNEVFSFAFHILFALFPVYFGYFQRNCRTCLVSVLCYNSEFQSRYNLFDNQNKYVTCMKLPTN